MPHRELNDRFKAHIARAQRVRRTAAMSVFCVCMLVGTGVAFEIVAPPHSVGRSWLTENIRGALDAASDAFASAPALPRLPALPSITKTIAPVRAQLAAVSSGIPPLDATADRIYKWLCPYFTHCEEPDVTYVATKTTPKPALPTQPVQPQQAIAPVAQPASSPQPKPAHQTTVNQPVIERIRERCAR